MHAKWVLSSAVVVFLFLSGCSGAGPAAKVAIGPSFAPDAEVDADRGAIRGFVLDDEENPIALTQLLLRPGDVTTTSANDGSFVFSLLDPGTYTIFGSRLGFLAPEMQADVTAGETTEVTFWMSAIAVAVARHQIVGPYNGYFQCRWGMPLVSGPCGAPPVVDTSPVYSQVWTKDVNRFDFQLQGDDWEEIVFETKWMPSSVATNSRMNQVFSFTGRESNHWFGRSNVTDSPLKWSMVKGVKNPLENTPDGSPQEPNATLMLRTWLATPPGSVTGADVRPASLAYEMRFEMVVTVFYNQRAPADWNAMTS